MLDPLLFLADQLWRSDHLDELNERVDLDLPLRDLVERELDALEYPELILVSELTFVALGLDISVIKDGTLLKTNAPRTSLSRK